METFLPEAVEIVDALGAGVDEDAIQLGVAPDDPAPRPVSGSIQELGHHPFPAMLEKEFVCLAADGGFFGMNHELAVFPLVAVGGTAVDGFARAWPS